ncbi:hypothetical protein LNV23_02600 [Paucibacter sp. DJ1R-11]|uniref:hypothetical protein n=1 Tax=Paucibacter sp. DJ1R-11 TaxID=2893556 RepID=UPI0021E4A44F|nr:hypothetical protein [Paucibacter sp. DJ1R-11]MCV2362335.1 hypothetical protein [Paucibacter sp. DJ1R-11]
MPNSLVLKGEVFSLDASAGFDEGLIRGNVGAGARLQFDTQQSLCHGLAVQAAAQARADASAQLGLFGLLSGEAEGAAFAAAGVKLVAQATIDPFDKAGLEISVEAYAEASVAGRLAVSLDFQDLARLASEKLDGPALEIFLALLREIKLGAGVWARIAAAAMARGHLTLQLSLADDDKAGFVIAGSLAAGAGVGMGVDVYAGARFESPKRFFLNAVDIAMGALVTEARRYLPPSLRVHLAALEFALPALLNASYEIAQIDSAKLGANPALAGEVFAACITAELQRFVLDKLALGAATLVAARLDAIANRLSAAPLPDAKARAAAAAVRAAMELLEGKALTLTSASEALPALVAVLDAVDAAGRSIWRPALAAMWLSLAAADALRKGVVARTASASAGVIGLATQVSQAMSIEIRDVPAFVQDELQARLGIPRSSKLDFKILVAWLVDTKLLPQLRMAVPEVSPLLDLIERELDISDVLTAALRGDIKAAYPPCRALASRLLDELLIKRLLPQIASLMPDNEPGRLWAEEVAGPSLLMVRNFVLSRLDDAVAGRLFQQEPLRAALGLMVGKIVISHVVVLQDILVDHIRDNVAQAARDLSDQLRDGKRTPLVNAFNTLAQPLLAVASTVIPKAVVLEASQELAADLLLVLASATGEQVWTDARRAQERDLLRRILFSVYGEADKADPNTFMADVAACTYLPAPQAVFDMVKLQAEMMAATLGHTLPATLAAIDRFFRRLGDSAIQQIETGMAAALASLRDDLVVIGKTLVALGRQAEARLAEVERFTREISRQLGIAATACRSAARRNQILDRLQREGAANARTLARQVPGFGMLPREARALALTAATNAFGTGFAAVRPALNGVLQVLGEVGDDIARLFAAAADLAAFLASLTKAITDRLNAAVRALANLKLPREIPIQAIIDAAVSTLSNLPLIRDALSAAFGARQNEQTAKDRLRQIRTEIAKKELLQDAKEKALDAATVGGALGLSICSPVGVSTDPQANCTYHTNIPLRITVAGISAKSNKAMDGRVVLLLNGQPLTVPDSAWQLDKGLFRLSHSLSVSNPGVKPGLNVLECACAGGGRPAQRARKTFLVNKTAPPTDGLRVSVANGAIVISGNAAAATLQGWRVIVPGGRVFTGVLKPGTPTIISKLVSKPTAGAGPSPVLRPSLPTTISIPSIGLNTELRPVTLAPCLRAITVIDAAGRHRLDHLTGDEQ